ncbi:MAG TPA: GNAT family N-acetyltransferase [Candidatus Eisenbacteria bacterium]|nr:GNAT family N-acetyltransferase [Candidatus Eisenbacteria bacterium]
MSVEIRPLSSADDLARARRLFSEYAASLPFDLSFQDFERELAGLPGAYALPSGALLLAMEGNEPAGCVALRALAPEVCEMKRLYVRPSHRGTGLGRRLVHAIMTEGRSRGYARMRLDTVPGMEAAIALYRACGFHEIPPYRANPIQGALFLEAELGSGVDPPGGADRASDVA